MSANADLRKQNAKGIVIPFTAKETKSDPDFLNGGGCVESDEVEQLRNQVEYFKSRYESTYNLYKSMTDCYYALAAIDFPNLRNRMVQG